MFYSTGFPYKDRGFDLSSLPTTETIKAHPSKGIFMLIFGTIFSGIFVLAAIGIARETPYGWSVLIFAVFGLVVLIGGIQSLLKKQIVSISKKYVQVTERSLFGDNQWEASLEVYKGVLNEVELHSSGSGSSRRTYKIFTLKLLHDDPKKTVKIFESKKEEGHRQRWEDASRLFSLPALEKHEDEIVSRDAEDLDKNVKELLASEKITINTEALQQTPKGLSITEAADEWILTYKMKTNPIGYFIFLLISGGMIYFGFFHKKVPAVVGIGGIVFALVLTLIFIATLITIIKISISSTTVIMQNLVFGKALLNESIIITDIEEIKIGTLQGKSGKGVILTGDSGEIMIGDGLPEKSIEWLQATLLKKIKG